MKSQPKEQRLTLKVSLSERPQLKGQQAAFLFDAAGNFLEASEIKGEKVTFSQSEDSIKRTRLFIAPIPDNVENTKPTISMMERLNAFESSIVVGGKLVDVIQVPGPIIDLWPLCFCWLKGKVVKTGTNLPICRARVHICEVDKIWRWIIKLPDLDIFRLRDDFIHIIENPPIITPPGPQPDPAPFERITPLSNLRINAFDPQPEPPNNIRAISLSPNHQTSLLSNSSQVVRKALIENIDLLIPYLCYWPHWWYFRCDEIRVVETDALGRFQTLIPYSCTGDKPDLYFWVEYQINGVWTTVYHPPIACNTYWNHDCNQEVIIRISDSRVPSCDPDPDLSGCVVQVLSIGRNVSMSEIQTAGANEGLTTAGQPFGNKLEPRLWFSRSTLINNKNIRYYKWSYRLKPADPLDTTSGWNPLTRTVVRHFAKSTPSGIVHEPELMGPVSVGGSTNLFKIKPVTLPPNGIEWSVVDEREDLASGHFETQNLGSGTTAAEKALNAAGLYELKLELFKADGSLVNWSAEGIDLEVTNVPAPFGTNTVTTVNASNYNRIRNNAGQTVAFRMVLRVDNNRCEAGLLPVTGNNLVAGSCGFLEFISSSNAKLQFKAAHPNNFATFSFSVVKGVTDTVQAASVSAGRVGNTPIATNDASHQYQLNGAGNYEETFGIGALLGTCPRAAFSEAIRVYSMATDGYSRLSGLDASAHAGFALTPQVP